jgi:hypothetical protein
MKKTIILFAIIFTFKIATAQSTLDTIEVRKGTGFFYKGARLNIKQIADLTKDIPEATVAMKKAKTNLVPGIIFSAAGGFCIGYPLGGLIAGKKMNWTLLGIGGGLAAISIPFSIATAKHSRIAVNAYNRRNLATNLYKPEFMLGFTGDGAALKLKF